MSKKLREKNTLRANLSSKNFLKVSYTLMRKYDPATALFISMLIHLEKHNENNNSIDEDGFFMIKRDFIEKQIGLTKKMQMRITKNLQELGLIMYMVKGLPPIGHVKLHHNMINCVTGNSNFDHDFDPL